MTASNTFAMLDLPGEWLERLAALALAS